MHKYQKNVYINAQQHIYVLFIPNNVLFDHVADLWPTAGGAAGCRPEVPEVAPGRSHAGKSQVDI